MPKLEKFTQKFNFLNSELPLQTLQEVSKMHLHSFMSSISSESKACVLRNSIVVSGVDIVCNSLASINSAGEADRCHRSSQLNPLLTSLSTDGDGSETPWASNCCCSSWLLRLTLSLCTIFVTPNFCLHVSLAIDQKLNQIELQSETEPTAPTRTEFDCSSSVFAVR